MTQELIKRPSIPIEAYNFNETALELKNLALDGGALIGKVTNAEENQKAVDAQRELKRVMNLFERERKAAKEPLLELGRTLDRKVAAQVEELDKEFGRISILVTEFQLAEQRRVNEERRKQQEELDRIEREKQAELRRIADEQAAREAEARKIADAAAREAQMKRIAEQAAEQKVQAVESSQDRVTIAAKPVVATREEGQIVKTDWEITVTNPYELAKFHPDCVLEIKPALSQIKAYLNQGMTIRGIKAVKKTVAGVRAAPSRALIEV